MDIFNEVTGLVQSAITAFGTFWLVWGLFVLGTGLKDKTAPDIKQGMGQIVGGALILAGAYLIGTISM